jgi:hypothetical protein
MRRVDPKLWLSFALVLAASASACSAIVDFPKERLEERDDGGARLDAGRDADLDEDAEASLPSRDASPDARPDAEPASCKVDVLSSCGDNKLCCDRSDGRGPSCIDVSGGSDCTECGVACKDPSAPHCGNRQCECEAGSGQGCGAGRRCLGEGRDAKCVECTTDADCAGRADNHTQCVGNQCEECDRGAKLDDASDDQGCPTSSPICSADNTCTVCSAEPDNCPGDTVCNPGKGCYGCTLGTNAPCNGTSPICKAVLEDGREVLQCSRCVANADCMGRFCAETTGACTNACDPDNAPGGNGCNTDPSKPFCKPAGADFACAPCAATGDCKAPAPHCAVDGAQVGRCVQCRSSADCDQSGPTPVCSVSGTCRERVASDCTAPGKTRFDPVAKSCVECVTATETADCAASPGGRFCGPTGSCVQCRLDANCPSNLPVCTNNVCTAECMTDANCSTKPSTPYCVGGGCVACRLQSHCPSAAAPICSPVSASCVPCNAVGISTAAADALCAGKTPGTVCVSASGACGTCDPADNRGCVAPATCIAAAGINTCVGPVLPVDAGIPPVLPPVLPLPVTGL